MKTMSPRHNASESGCSIGAALVTTAPPSMRVAGTRERGLLRVLAASAALEGALGSSPLRLRASRTSEIAMIGANIAIASATRSRVMECRSRGRKLGWVVAARALHDMLAGSRCVNS